MTEHVDRVDVAVIGAGLAGLTAAATVARAGASVVLLDARPPGGRARSIERNGFVLNDGGHALYTAGAGAAVLADLGVTYTGGAPRIEEAYAWWDDRLVRMPVTPKALLTTKLLGVRSKLAAGRLFRVIGRGTADAAAGLSFDEWLERRRVPADLRAYVLALAQLSTYAAQPGAMAAPAAIRQLNLATQGVLYLDGGWQTLVDGLLRVGATAGVQVVQESVTGIERDDGGLAVVTPGRTVVAASVVIAAGGPELAARLAGRDPGWVEQSGPPVEVACLDIGVTTAPSVELIVPGTSPLYFSVHSPTAALGPKGQFLISLMRYLEPDSAPSHEVLRAELEAHAARGGVGTERVFERFMASMTVAWGQPLADRARPRGDELASEGIFVAGDWIGDSLLGDASLASGSAAGTAAARRTAIAA